MLLILDLNRSLSLVTWLENSLHECVRVFLVSLNSQDVFWKCKDTIDKASMFRE
jgi:hypothetical protein